MKECPRFQIESARMNVATPWQHPERELENCTDDGIATVCIKLTIDVCEIDIFIKKSQKLQISILKLMLLTKSVIS